MKKMGFLLRKMSRDVFWEAEQEYHTKKSLWSSWMSRRPRFVFLQALALKPFEIVQSEVFK